MLKDKDRELQLKSLCQSQRHSKKLLSQLSKILPILNQMHILIHSLGEEPQPINTCQSSINRNLRPLPPLALGTGMSKSEMRRRSWKSRNNTNCRIRKVILSLNTIIKLFNKATCHLLNAFKTKHGPLTTTNPVILRVMKRAPLLERKEENSWSSTSIWAKKVSPSLEASASRPLRKSPQSSAVSRSLVPKPN
jgi:hypothetical protein